MKKKRPELTYDGSAPQDWTTFAPGQNVQVQDIDGKTFAAVVESKTRNSNAVWLIRDDGIRTRQVFCHTEGVLLSSIDQSTETDSRRNWSNGT